MTINYPKRHPGDIRQILRRKIELLLIPTTYEIAHKRVIMAQDSWSWYSILRFAILEVMTCPRRSLPGTALLYLAITTQITMVLVYDSGVRYRIPLIPLLALMASFSAVEAPSVAQEAGCSG